jgi:hypothetical protein
MEQRRKILWERDRGVVCWMIRECEARWQCLPEGQLSLSKQGDGSEVADTTISYFPRSPLKCQKQQKYKEASRGPESSIDAMLLMKVHGRTDTPR